MKKFEEEIVNELLRILFLLRVGAIIGLLSLFWFTPMPWKAIVMAPFVGGPLMALGEQVLQRPRATGGTEHTLAEMIRQVHNRRRA